MVEGRNQVWRAFESQDRRIALEGLLELDATLKGHAGGGDLRRRAAVSLWIAERVRRPSQR